MHRLIHAAEGRTDDDVDVSIVLDLIAGPLSAGAPLAGAVAAVGECLPGHSRSASLQRAGHALERGTPATVALAVFDGPWAPLRETAVMGEAVGADLAALLRSAAADSRRRRAREAEAAAARLAVRLVLPTGLALLPAFVALGIVPTVASLLGGSFGEAFG